MKINENQFNQEYQKELINFYRFQIDLGINFYSQNQSVSLIENQLRDLLTIEDIQTYENFLLKYLSKNKIKYVPGSGDKSSKLFLISDTLMVDNPIDLEQNNNKKHPFENIHKELLEKMLNAIDIRLSNIFSLNLDKSLFFFDDKFKSIDKGINARIIIEKYINLIKPDFIINMSNLDFGILNFSNLKFIPFVINIDSPSVLITKPELKRNAWNNLKKLKEKFDVSDI